ncbi:unnamed protein product [Mycena citricolor]|uniref:Uncharacterized protein n=1 Tax=Mycena citricolor TaxID=2018698 RepID=A0AAD2GZC6_9AGAR|nr:unnamed protein product [Mycena citricolor]
MSDCRSSHFVLDPERIPAPYWEFNQRHASATGWIRRQDCWTFVYVNLRGDEKEYSVNAWAMRAFIEHNITIHDPNSKVLTRPVGYNDFAQSFNDFTGSDLRFSFFEIGTERWSFNTQNPIPNFTDFQVRLEDLSTLPPGLVLVPVEERKFTTTSALETLMRQSKGRKDGQNRRDSKHRDEETRRGGGNGAARFGNIHSAAARERFAEYAVLQTKRDEEDRARARQEHRLLEERQRKATSHAGPSNGASGSGDNTGAMEGMQD